LSRLETVWYLLNNYDERKGKSLKERWETIFLIVGR
jgi:hypothetical protein